MAACAIASAKQKIDHLLYSQSNIPNHLPIPEILSFYDKVLTDLELVICWQRRKKLIAIDLEQQIEYLADKIDDLICSHFSSIREAIKIRQEITRLRRMLRKGHYKIEADPPPLQFQSPADDELLFGRYDSILGRCPDPVGLESEIHYLKFIVLKGSLKLKATLVCGMAGCGKTTLVEKVYPELFCFFEIHAWLTIALHFTFREILVYLLIMFGFQFDETMGEVELGMSLMNLLKGKRYLCVLDNLYDCTTWERLKVFFPDDCNRSRIIFTSRDMWVLQMVPEFHSKVFLNDDDSWKLLRDVVFGTEEFSNSHLEEIGKEIAKKCEGLPLAVISIGKLLREFESTVESWTRVLEDDDPFQIEKHDCQPMSKSLYLSYDLLPYHQKLCFLYMGVFPATYDIKPSQLIMLWITEGLISPKENESLKDAAARYFEELCSKHMVVYKQTIVVTFKVHVVFRSLCIREAQNVKFCLAIKKYAQIFSEGMSLQRRLCIHNNTLFGFKEVHESLDSMVCVSSIRYCGPQHQYPLRVCFNFKDLKILHALSIQFYEFPLEVLELLRLRYLAITYDGQVPRSISKLWNLEVLILGQRHTIKSSYGPSYLPIEIWNLQWLKQINCTGSDLLDPRCIDDVLKYLSELSGVSSRSCTPKILARMHNLKKLVVHLEFIDHCEVESFDFFQHVAQNLKCLDSFECVVLQVFDSHVVPSPPVFPTTISELCLSGCGFPWKYMSAIMVLPNLQTLKLTHFAFSGPVWEVCDGKFPKLKGLIMKDLNIEVWKAKSEQFPSLFKLEIHHCYNLQAIPIDFVDLPILEQIYLFSNEASLEKSAREIQRGRSHDLEDDKFELLISKLGSSGAPHIAMPRDNFFYSTMLAPEAAKT